jgi:hypothetical protein
VFQFSANHAFAGACGKTSQKPMGEEKTKACYASAAQQLIRNQGGAFLDIFPVARP